MYIVANNIVHKDDCSRVKKQLVKGVEDTRTIAKLSEILEDKSIKACRCCGKMYKDLVAQHQLKKIVSDYYAYIEQRAKGFGYECEITHNHDLLIKTTIEKWIVHITHFISTEEMTAKVILYHRNAFNDKIQTKCGKYDYPEYHTQFTKVITPFEIVEYVKGHETGKYGVTVNYISEFDKNKATAKE